jgi:hypothetical protein
MAQTQIPRGWAEVRHEIAHRQMLRAEEQALEAMGSAT